MKGLFFDGFDFLISLENDMVTTALPGDNGDISTFGERRFLRDMLNDCHEVQFFHGLLLAGWAYFTLGSVGYYSKI